MKSPFLESIRRTMCLKGYALFKHINKDRLT